MIREQKKASPLPMIMLVLLVIGAAGVGSYHYIRMKGVKPAAKENQPACTLRSGATNSF